MKTQRNVLITALNYMHEHLGQAIACARMNAIVPPGSAEYEAAEKAKKAKAGG